jgi:hypothetical protein
MRRKEVHVLLISAILMVVLGSSSLATVTWLDPQLEIARPLIGPNTTLPPATSSVPYVEPAEPAKSLGQTFALGTTWYDYQHNGTCEKMVALSPKGGVHFCWMNGYQAQALDRHIFYNYYNPTIGDLSWPGSGFGPLDQGERAGYATCSVFSEAHGTMGGQAVAAYHGRATAVADWLTEVSFDFMEGSGAFQAFTIDNLAPPIDPLIWPHVTVDNQDFIHVVSCESEDAVVYQVIAYARSEDGGYSYTTFEAIDTIATIPQCVAASPVSNKVGITYTKSAFDLLSLGPYDGLLVSQMNNDIVLIESEDGTTWDFSNKQNITSLIEPDSSRYPDTTYANGDTMRAYCDVSLLYDMNDDAHVAFTTRGFWFDASLYSPPPNTASDSFAVVGITLDASVIWHWSEAYDTITVVADGWYVPGDTAGNAGSGAWRSTVDRPSLGLDPNTGNIYCVYVRCPQGDTSGGPIPGHGWSNGEIYCSVSTDGGLNWSEGTNLTNTPSEDCTMGNCFDEDYPSLAAVVNDTLHVIYIEDKDAGGVVQTAPQEGAWTENPVKYLKVPASEVATTPLLPNYAFHVSPSGTGVEEPCLVSGQVPEKYALDQNYPNPFNPETAIRFHMPQAGQVSLRIYNVTGQLVRELTDGHRETGSYQVRWDGQNDQNQLVPSGIYFCRMTAGQYTSTRKLALIK